ncbi:hypothetical protein AYI69_g2171 [Smittium culicis]|uniref:Uncharacterized protein n=1 Tax=Smittium culicis TaxID=133412 RepID=A0A1R1YNA0_9FUNG|nr:hypothetical protein AYI69_g2171 [Smittium culicis]
MNKRTPESASIAHLWNGDKKQRNFPQSFLHQDPGSMKQGQKISQRCIEEIERPGEFHLAQEPSFVHIEIMDTDNVLKKS